MPAPNKAFLRIVRGPIKLPLPRLLTLGRKTSSLNVVCSPWRPCWRSHQPISPSSPRPGNMSAGSCATETGPRVCRSRAISRPFLRPCLAACAEFSRGPMLGFIVGSLSQRTRRRKPPSSLWRKTPRLLEELEKVHWRRSAKTDADAQCEFRHQPGGRPAGVDS